MKMLLIGLAILCVASTTTERQSQIGSLPRCESARLLSTTDWVQLEQREGFALRLPSCFTRDDGTPRFVHGGSRWRCDEATVEVVWGMWGLGSFGEQQKCRTSVAGVPVMVARAADVGAASLVVSYLTGTVHEPMISAFSNDPADLALLTTIAYSGRVTAAAGSNR